MAIGGGWRLLRGREGRIGLRVMMLLAIVVWVSGFQGPHSPEPLGLGLTGLLAFKWFILLWAAVAFHELAHVVVGRLTGLSLMAVRLGIGPKLWEGVIRGVDVKIRLVPLRGMVYVVPEADQSGLRWRLMAMIAAGPLNDIVMALLALLAMQWDAGLPQPSVAYLAIDAAHSWMWLNIALAVLNLNPLQLQRTARFRNDGSRLLALLRGDTQELELYRLGRPLTEGMLCYEKQDYIGALASWQRALTTAPDSPNLIVGVSAAMIELNRPAEARVILAELLERKDVDQLSAAAAKTNISIADIMLDDPALIEEANRYSTAAIKEMGCNQDTAYARALVLLRLDKAREAARLIKPWCRFGEKPARAECRAVMGLAFLAQGKADEASRELIKARSIGPNEWAVRRLESKLSAGQKVAL